MFFSSSASVSRTTVLVVVLGGGLSRLGSSSSTIGVASGFSAPVLGGAGVVFLGSSAGIAGAGRVGTKWKLWL